MPYVIIDTAGMPLCDVAGNLIILGAREEAARWTTRGERVEPYIPRRHDVVACDPLAQPSRDDQTGDAA